MKARVVSFARGARWLAEGWGLFRVAPLVWLGLVFLYWLLMTTLSLLPLVGIGAATVLIPAFSVGFMVASRSCEGSRAPELAQLFAGFRGGAWAQLKLGGVYLAALALLLGATTLADDGALARWMLTGERPDEEALRSDAFLAALLVAAGGYMPVMMMFWFAPVLAAWHGLGAAQALFFSFFASLMNWRAFFGYAAAAAVLTIGIPFLVLGALLLATGGKLRLGVMALVFPLLIVLLPILFASFYASYRDVFGTVEQNA
ncbi:MAG: BPSS1780 family membrane protein [Burkholderiales bacterium]